MKRLWIQNLCIVTVFLISFFLIVSIGIEEGKKSQSVQIAGVDLRDKEPETAPTEETTPSLSLNLTEESIVYMTKSGKKYHLWADCSALKQATEIIATQLKDVAAKGNALCSFCNKRQNPNGE